MTDIDLQDIHDFLISIALKAGEMIRSAHPTTAGVDLKKNSTDLVTETDRAVEAMVSSSLNEKYPDFKFMGEETHKPGDVLTPSPTFIVDPIDGTTNFVHGCPHVSISLGLAVALQPVVGVVYNPFLDVLYTAIKGRGAFRNRSTPLPFRANPAPPPLGDLSSLLVAVEWGSDRSGNDFDVKSRTFARLCASGEQGGAMVHGLRSFGSAALNLCAVAEGGVDVYWEAGCWAWDVCAGWCILEEAGGMVVDGNPGGWEPVVDERRYLAVRGGEGRRECVEAFWGVIVGRFEVGR